MKQAIFPLCRVKLPFALDLLERAIAATFFSFFALRILNAYMATGNAGYLLLLFSECLVISFLLLRRMTSEVSLSPADWCVAAMGTTLPLLAVAGGEPLIPGSLSGVIMVVGLATNVWAKLSLRRSFGIVAANRGIKTQGPYSIIRHPMYSGYLITQIGFFLSNPTFWNLTIYSAGFSFQVLRMLAEERTLSQDSRYTTYAEKVRYRLIPRVF